MISVQLDILFAASPLSFPSLKWQGKWYNVNIIPFIPLLRLLRMRQVSVNCFSIRFHIKWAVDGGRLGDLKRTNRVEQQSIMGIRCPTSRLFCLLVTVFPDGRSFRSSYNIRD